MRDNSAAQPEEAHAVKTTEFEHSELRNSLVQITIFLRKNFEKKSKLILHTIKLHVVLPCAGIERETRSELTVNTLTKAQHATQQESSAQISLRSKKS